MRDWLQHPPDGCRLVEYEDLRTWVIELAGPESPCPPQLYVGERAGARAVGGFRGGGRACAGCIRGAAGSRCRSSIFHTTCRRPPAAPPPAPCPPHAHSHPTRSPPAARHSLRPGELFSLRIVFSERYPLEPPEVRGGGGVRACGRGGTGGGGARGHRGAGYEGSGHGDSGRAAAQHTMCKGLLRWRHDRDGSRPFGAAEPPPLLLARGAAAAGCLITITSFPSLALRVQVTFVPPSPVHPHIYRCVLCCMLGGGGWGAEGVAGLGGVAT